jgi:hypothetical protein
MARWSNWTPIRPSCACWKTLCASIELEDKGMTYQEYCDLIRDNYQPRHPHLYTLREEVVVPALVRAVRAGTPDALRRVVREAHPQVYVFDMLRPEFCGELLEEAGCFEEWCSRSEVPLIRPNTMNNYGSVLDSYGFAPMLQQLLLQYIVPFSSLLYADVGGASLDSHHGFIVEYKIGKDTKLDFHVDASDVTLNVCLGKQFSGGTLFFRGVRCGLCQLQPPRPEEEFEIGHVPGQAILHRGKHRHGANPLQAGERYNLIVWCNSSRFAREHDQTRCPPWCGGREPKA